MDYSSALIRKSSTGQLITGCDFPFPITGISLFMENGSVLTVVAYNSGLRGLADSIFLWAHNCKETDLNENHHDDAPTVSSSSSSPSLLLLITDAIIITSVVPRSCTVNTIGSLIPFHQEIEKGDCCEYRIFTFKVHVE
jgi:hypothetical protein